MWYFDEAGALFNPTRGWLKLTDDAGMTQEAGSSTLPYWFPRLSMGVTALSMLTSIACGVYANGGFVITPTPEPPTALVQVNIPFNTLHLAIALGIVIAIVLNILFNLEGVCGLFMSAVLLGFLLCNREARKHVRLRLRQLIDRFTVGGNNSVGPIATIALAVRAQVDETPQSTRRWAEPSLRYAVTLPEFLDVIDVTETSM